MSRVKAILALLLALGALVGTVAPAAAQTGGLPAYKLPASSRFDVAGTVNFLGSTIAFRGAGSQSGSDAQTDLTISGAGGATPTTVNLIQIGTKTYTNTGSGWQVLDAAQAASQMGGVPGLGGVSLTDALRLLNAASNARQTGKEAINGAPTTQYQADVDLMKVLSLAGVTPDPQTAAILKNAGMTLYLWIGDNDQYIYRERIVLTVKVPADPNAGTPELNLTEDMTLTFRDFGAPITITAPPDAVPVTAPGGVGGILGGANTPPGASPGGAGTGAPLPGPSVAPAPGMPRTGGPNSGGLLAALGLAAASLLAGWHLRRLGTRA